MHIQHDQLKSKIKRSHKDVYNFVNGTVPSTKNIFCMNVCYSDTQNLQTKATGWLGTTRCAVWCCLTILMTKTAKENHEQFDYPTTELNYRSLHLAESAQKHFNLSRIPHHFDQRSSCNHFDTNSHTFVMCVMCVCGICISFSVLTELRTKTGEFNFRLKNCHKMSPDSALLPSRQMPCSLIAHFFILCKYLSKAHFW